MCESDFFSFFVPTIPIATNWNRQNQKKKRNEKNQSGDGWVRLGCVKKKLDFFYVDKPIRCQIRNNTQPDEFFW